MKTLVGNASVLAAVLALAPLSAFAQSGNRTQPMMNRGVDRYTLLPGPSLLSPARNVPTMAPAPLKLGEAPSVFLVPYNTPPSPATSPSPASGSTLLPLKSGTSAEKPSIRDVPSPEPDLFRFDHTFEAPKPAGRWQFERVPERAPNRI